MFKMYLFMGAAVHASLIFDDLHDWNINFNIFVFVWTVYFIQSSNDFA